MEAPADLDVADSEKVPVKKPRATVACLACRRRRIKCSGDQPSCTQCSKQGRACEWNLEGDRRKPYTREVVEALQQQVASLEAKVARLSVGPSAEQNIGSLSPPPLEPAQAGSPDALDGGLAHNADGEVRFFGPGSTHSVLAESNSTAAGIVAARHSALTKAPFPISNYTDPEPPPLPPVLSSEFKHHLLQLAFEFALPTFSLIDERRFYADMVLAPHDRTLHYSPFMLNVLLALGCRYLDPEGDFPRSICSDPTDVSTRGNVHMNYARFSLEREWDFPKISTIRSLACMSLYLRGMGTDGLAWLYIGAAARVAENFGLHLGIHHLAGGDATVDHELVVARRDTFFAVFGIDVSLAMPIGRNPTFRPDEFDQEPPPVDSIVDFDIPYFRSSAMHWSSKLIVITAKILTAVYVKRGIGLAARRSEVPALHLELSTWYHSLPSHIKVSPADAAKVATKPPHTHIIGVNMLYWLTVLQLHRPFFSRLTATTQSQPSSAEKCLLAASHIVRLVKLQEKIHGIRFAHPVFAHAAFTAGTILALSASQSGISPTPLQDAERQAQASKDLGVVVAALRTLGQTTWPGATSSADILCAVGESREAPTFTVPPPPVPLDASIDPLATTTTTGTVDGSIMIDPSIIAAAQLHQQQQQQQQQQPFTCFSEQMFPSWDFQDSTGVDFELQMNTLSNNPFSGLSEGVLPW